MGIDANLEAARLGEDSGPSRVTVFYPTEHMTAVAGWTCDYCEANGVTTFFVIAEQAEEHVRGCEFRPERG